MINNNKILSVITARANSKGLPGKNTRILAMRPLVQWSMIHSLASRYVDFTVVSSNCEKVKEATDDLLSWDMGYEWKLYDLMELIEDGNPDNRLRFVQRPDEFATDTSPNEEALIHAYHYCKENFDFQADWIMNLQPTSPVRTHGLVDKCIEKMYASYADSLLTVTRTTPFMWQYKGLNIECNYDVVNRPMRQKIQDDAWLFHDNGNVYITEVSVLLERKCRIGLTPVIFETDKFQSLQIDDEQDFILIEKIMKEIL